MNGTPRALNRILLFIIGAKLLAIGVLLVLLATVPAVAEWWPDPCGPELRMPSGGRASLAARRAGSGLWRAWCSLW